MSSEQEYQEQREEQPAAENPPPAEDQQPAPTQPPAEPDWPTNGGPLGCLLGSITGFVLGGFVGTTLLIFNRPIAIVLTVLLTIGLAVAGWQIGRRIFREYKPPKVRQPKKR